MQLPKAFLLLLVLGIRAPAAAVNLQSNGQQTRKPELHEQLKTKADVAVSIQNPEVIKAGELLKFSISLDKGSSIDGTVVMFSIIGPDTDIQTSSEPLKAGQSRCDVSFKIPADAPSGVYRIHILSLYTGTKQLPLESSDITFGVVANTNLEFPTRAKITVNPSQVQLLRTEAVRLQRRVEQFRVELMDQGSFSTKALRGELETSMHDLDETEAAFLKLSTDATLESAAKVFFDDLRRNYNAESSVVQQKAIAENIFLPKLLLVADRPRQSQALAAHAFLRSLELNELAYTNVADNDSLYFNLKVESVPAGASVFLRRRGDDYKQQAEPTNTTINNLVRAVWQVRFEMGGYRPYEVEYNPFTDPNNVIAVALKKSTP